MRGFLTLILKGHAYLALVLCTTRPSPLCCAPSSCLPVAQRLIARRQVHPGLRVLTDVCLNDSSEHTFQLPIHVLFLSSTAFMDPYASYTWSSNFGSSRNERSESALGSLPTAHHHQPQQLPPFREVFENAAIIYKLLTGSTRFCKLTCKLGETSLPHALILLPLMTRKWQGRHFPILRRQYQRDQNLNHL